LEGDGRHMSIYGLLAWIGTALSMLGYWYNVKKNKICFLFWEVATIIIVANFLFGKPDKMVYYATAFLFAYYGVMNIIGYLKWKKEEHESY
jgi:hypothetical protein